jgi:hypothetical protein
MSNESRLQAAYCELRVAYVLRIAWVYSSAESPSDSSQMFYCATRTFIYVRSFIRNREIAEGGVADCKRM